MTKPTWYPTSTSWTIKGVSETTRDAVRDAAAEADMLLGEWVDQALKSAARDALHPAPPPATKADVEAILQKLAELQAGVLALADSKASVQALADVKAHVEALGRRPEPVRAGIRQVAIERKKRVRRLAQPQADDLGDGGP